MNEKYNNEYAVKFTIYIGDYNLSTSDKDTLWIQQKDGEGMQVSKVDFDALIDKYFKENF